MADWSLNFARDLNNATLEYIEKRIHMTLKESTYRQLNMMMAGALQITGDKIQTHISLRDENNAKHYSNPWEADTFNVENITEKAESDWKFVKTNCSFNLIEMGMNAGKERIYDLMKAKIDNTIREMADEIQPNLILSPTGSSDATNINGLSAWFPLGTDGSTGDWNAYSGIYNDGSGTTFDAGGISSASGVANNERWASYYADHDGQLGDNLLDLIDNASLDLGFEPPAGALSVGEMMSWGGFKFFTNRAVIRNLRTLLRKSDDNLRSLENYHGVDLLNGIPLIYVPEANTARTTLYGTNPFWGVNMNFLKVYVLRGFKFKKSPLRVADGNHNIVRTHWDLVYNIHCSDRQRGGFLISQQ